MSQSEFLRKTFKEQVYQLYKCGEYIADTIYDRYRVQLIVLGGNCYEVFLHPISLLIFSIQPLDHTSIRLKKYNATIEHLMN